MSPGIEHEALVDGELLAAIDLGSNSFHMVVARYLLGQLRIVDRIREMVRMASGLDANGGLDPAAMERALSCLSRFGERVRTLPQHRVRVIATNTVRAMRNPQAFLVPAETALGHAIEVVSGREEARLIYLGVAHGLPPTSKRRLVIDIGGGSTEFIIGQGFDPLERESVQVGCVATTRRFFPDGKLSRKRWKQGLTGVAAEMQQFAAVYRERGWEETIGSSGTIRSIGQIVTGLKLARGAITDTSLEQAREALLEFPTLDDVSLPGLSRERRPVIAGGLLILEACFRELGIKRMQVCETAMREGVLYDMVGRAQQRDPRDASIAALARRYDIDTEHATRIEKTVLSMFAQVAEVWELDADDARMLGWAALMHEIGLVIAHSKYHVHGAYLIGHSDIAGFSHQEQQRLAALLRCQRRSIPAGVIEALPERQVTPTLRCIVLLRLAVLLHRSHDRAPLPPLQLIPGRHSLQLRLPRRWLDAHPLTGSDLETERAYLADIGFTLEIQAAD